MEEVTLEAAEVAADWAVATVEEAAVVSEAAAAAANRAGEAESAAVMVAEVAPAAVEDPVAVMALEAVLVAVEAAGNSKLQTGSFPPDVSTKNSGCHRTESFAAQVGPRALPARVSELKAKSLRSFPLLKSSGGAPVQVL